MTITLIEIVFTAIILIVSITIHEYSHAWMANRLGDPTPKIQGRLTLNPLAHIDILGLILVFIINFGWGKAVQYNPNYLKHPLQDELKIALIGPASNIILSIGAIIILILYKQHFGISEIFGGDFVIIFWSQFAFLNIALGIFNLLPIPPLDGYRLIKIRYPSIFYIIERYYHQYAFVLIGLLAISGILGPIISIPTVYIYNLLYSIISIIL